MKDKENQIGNGGISYENKQGITAHCY